MHPEGLLQIILALVLSPLLLGIINRVKAFYAGRKGVPLLQLYRDLFKLMQKGAVYSKTTTWIFKAGPIVNLAGVVGALFLLPIGPLSAFFSFPGDILCLVYLLGIAKFFVMLAALDTGSAFEGMGASREAQVSILAEVTLLLSLGVLIKITGETSLSVITADFSWAFWLKYTVILALLFMALLAASLAENARIPVDDPNTHLELTMIHEAMVLDHGGTDLAFIFYAQALKFWLFGSLCLYPIVPLAALFNVHWSLGIAVYLLGLGLFAAFTGWIESHMARLKMLRIPQFLLGSGALAMIAFLFTLR